MDSKNQEDTELGRLMHDFHCKAPEEMYNPVLRRRFINLKRPREGVTFMCREMGIIFTGMEREPGEKIGQERGEKIGKEARCKELTEKNRRFFKTRREYNGRNCISDRNS